MHNWIDSNTGEFLSHLQNIAWANASSNAVFIIQKSYSVQCSSLLLQKFTIKLRGQWLSGHSSVQFTFPLGEYPFSLINEKPARFMSKKGTPGFLPLLQLLGEKKVSTPRPGTNPFEKWNYTKNGNEKRTGRKLEKIPAEHWRLEENARRVEARKERGPGDLCITRARVLPRGIYLTFRSLCCLYS